MRTVAETETDASTPKYKLHRTVVLVGMMASGKSAIGRALAQMLNVTMMDSDAEIEAASRQTIAEIFERDGEAFFRDREAEVIDRLLTGEPCILSTGGGAFMAARNRQAIHDKGVSVFLNASLETLWERVRHKDTRPLLRTADPKQTLSDLLSQRQPIYELADLRVETRLSYEIEQTADLVIQAMLTRPDVLEAQE
jgi:shikimate kinase